MKAGLPLNVYWQINNLHQKLLTRSTKTCSPWSALLAYGLNLFMMALQQVMLICHGEVVLFKRISFLEIFVSSHKINSSFLVTCNDRFHSW